MPLRIHVLHAPPVRALAVLKLHTSSPMRHALASPSLACTACRIIGFASSTHATCLGKHMIAHVSSLLVPGCLTKQEMTHMIACAPSLSVRSGSVKSIGLGLPSFFCRMRCTMQLAKAYTPPKIAKLCKVMQHLSTHLHPP